MDENLYRKEVLTARRDDSYLGRIRLETPTFTTPLSLIATILVVLMLCTIAGGSYRHKEHVSGRIVPTGGLLKAIAPASGVATHVLVQEGLKVKAGQALVEISSSRKSSSSSLESAEALVNRQLLLQRDLLDREQKESLAAFSELRKFQEERIASLEEQAQIVGNKLKVSKAQALRARDMFERVQPLVETQVVSVLQNQQYENDAIIAEAKVLQVLQEQASIRAQLSSIKAELRSMELSTGRRQSEIDFSLAEVEQALARNDVQRGIVITASGSGTVSGLTVLPGQAVETGQRLLSIIPQGASIQAELWAPSSAAGALRVGGKVVVRYEAFPYQNHGSQYGTIVEVSRTTLRPEEIRSRTGIQVSEPSYRVLVSFDRESGKRDSRGVMPRIGMALEADLILERRRVYELLLGLGRSFGSGQR